MNALTKLEQIKTVPATIDFDFEGVKALVVAHLDRYQNIVITDDAVGEGKALIKEINVSRKALDKARKDEAKKAGEPIKKFERDIKELVSLHDTLLNNIREQIAKYEAARKSDIKNALLSALLQEWEDKGVRDQFRNGCIDSLILLGSFTTSGKLTAKACAEIQQIASNDYALQAQTDLRVAQLESACYQAGLGAPLTVVHIQHFIDAPEVEYQTRLNALLSSELEREKRAIEHRLMQQRRKEEKQALQKPVEQVEPKESHLENVIENKATETNKSKEPPKGLGSHVVITCTFELNISADIPEPEIRNQLSTKLKSAGFTSLSSMTVERVQLETMDEAPF